MVQTVQSQSSRNAPGVDLELEVDYALLFFVSEVRLFPRNLDIFQQPCSGSHFRQSDFLRELIFWGTR